MKAGQKPPDACADVTQFVSDSWLPCLIDAASIGPVNVT